MTTTRFLSAHDARELRCMGANHRDHGKLGVCGACGATVVRLERGRLVHPHMRHTAGEGNAYDYACWQATHECDARMVELFQAQRAQELASGALVVGQTVIVVRGRKVAKGTRGVIRWSGEGDYGPRLGLAVEGTSGLVYIAAQNVEPVTEEN